MVRGYNANVGADRAQESIRGFNAGWNSATPDLNTNKLTNLFDGIPMDNLDGEWRSSALPLASMIQGVNIIYGPGNPDTRWYDSIGGTINTIPIQPTSKAGADVNFSAGSYGAYTEEADLRTGLIDGWSTVIVAANTISNDFRGYGSGDLLAKGQYLFLKTVKTLGSGWISFGAYAADNLEKRPNFIPVSPADDADATAAGSYIGTGGLGVGSLYNQQTSGFYASLPYYLKGKETHIVQRYLYSQLELNLASDLTFNNEVWYRHGSDEHYKEQWYDVYGNGGGPVDEENQNPHYSDTFGDRAVFDLNVPYNDIKFGGYYIDEKFESGSMDPNMYPNINGGDPFNFSDDLYYYQFLSAFLQDDIKPAKNLVITPGLNFVSYNDQYYNNGCAYWLAGDPNFAADCATDTTSPNNGETPGSLGGSSNTRFHTNAIEPSIGLNYRVLPFMAVYGDYAVLYQSPDNASFTYAPTGNGVYVAGTLSPIQTFDNEYGVKFMVHHNDVYLNNFVFNVNYYQDNISKQAMGYNPDPFNPNIETYSFASEFYKGYNIYLSDDPLKNMHVFADLNLQHNVYTSFVGQSGDSYSGYPISNSPDENFNVDVSYKVPFRDYVFKPELTDQFIGKQYLYSNNLDPNAPFAPTHMTEPGYNIINFDLNVKTEALNRFIPDVKSTAVNFNMYNCFNRQFNVIEYYDGSGGVFYETPPVGLGDLLAEPGMPRAFYVTLSFNFGAPHE